MIGRKVLCTSSKANCKWDLKMKEPFASFVKTHLEPRTLLITCGLPASYKTETSEEIAKIKSYPILRSDLIRLEVLKNEDIFDAKVAGNMNKRLSVYDEVFRRADELETLISLRRSLPTGRRISRQRQESRHDFGRDLRHPRTPRACG